jgi:Protein of unknown function (DUF2752)
MLPFSNFLEGHDLSIGHEDYDRSAEGIRRPSAPRVTRSIKVFSPLLRHRIGSLATVCFAVLHMSLKLAGHGGVPCPVRELSGVTCPGCGLGTALLQLATGEWREALARHAFAPVFGLGLLLLVVVNVLPAGPRMRVIDHVTAWEERTSFGLVLLMALICYWLLRLG